MAAEIIEIKKNGIVQYPITKSECVLNNEGKTITEVLLNKVDKEEGKGLSTNDYTDADKQKLVGLANYDDSGIKKDIEDLSKKVEELEQGGQGGSTPDLSEYLTKEEFNEVSERYATTEALEDYLTTETFNEVSERFATTDALEGKQDTIEDLDSIRSGAGKGATAVQPSTLANYATTQQLTELSAEVGKKVDADFVNNAIAESLGTLINGDY